MAKIKLRRDTYQNWYDANPVLASGEPAYDTTNNKIKVGDGTTAWRDLSYLTDESGGGGGTGNINFVDTTIYAPEGSPIVIEGTYSSEYEGIMGSKVSVQGSTGRVKLSGYALPDNNVWGDTFWDTAEWTTNEFGIPVVSFTNAPDLLDFMLNTFSAGYDKYIRINGGNWKYFSSGISSGPDNGFFFQLDPEDTPPTDPTTITLFETKYQRESYIDLNSDDAIRIKGTGLDIEIESATGSANLKGGDWAQIQAGEAYVWVENGSAYVEVSDNNGGSSTFQFDYNSGSPKLRLPPGADIVDNNGTSVLATSNEPFGTFSTLPDFLDFYPHTNVKAGQNSQGIFFSGDNIDDTPYVSYPVRTNFSINGSTKVVVTVDMTVNSECSDFGICVFESGVNPQWNWDPDTTRIAAQYDCTVPFIYGGEGQISDNSWQIPGNGTYRVRFTYDPNATPNVTLETLDTGDNVLSLIFLNEVLNPANSYRIGFSADQDDDKLRTYINNLTIAVNGGETYTDSLQLGGGGSGVDGLSANTNYTPEEEGDTRYSLDINEDITLKTYQGAAPGPTTLGPGISLGQSIGESHRAGVVAIGNDDVGYNSKQGGVYIGAKAGWNSDEGPQGEFAIAIGARAAYNFAEDNSITLNATGDDLDPTGSGLFVKPVRESTDGQIMLYNSDSGEVTYSQALGGAGTGVTITAGDTTKWVARQQQDIKIDGSGYTNIIKPESLRYDSDGNLFVATRVSEQTEKLCVTKYSTTGAVVWQKTYTQQVGDFNEIKNLLVDSSGNLVITGDLDGGASNNKPFIFKINGALGSDEAFWVYDSMLVDSVNDVYAELFSNGDIAMALEVTTDDIRVYVVRINSSTGLADWVGALTKSAGIDFDIYGIAVDSDDNVFINTRVDKDNGEHDIAIFKMDSSGNLLWQRSFQLESQNDPPKGGDLTTDSQGNVFGVINYNTVIETPSGENSTGTAVKLFKISSNGTLQWTRLITGPCGSSVTTVDSDSDGNLYIGALTIVYGTPNNESNQAIDRFFAGDNKFILAKYNPNGVVLWQRYLDLKNASEGWDADNRPENGQQMSVYGDKIATMTQALRTEGNPFGSNYSTTFTMIAQLPTSGEECVFGKDDDRVSFVESRVPGRLYTNEQLVTTSHAYGFFDPETFAVNNSETMTVSGSAVANMLVRSETYEYTFGGDGTLTIPNDGDIRLTQSEKGWFALFGYVQNDEDDLRFTAVTHDSEGNLIAGGEDNNSGMPFVVKFDQSGNAAWAVKIYDDNDNTTGRVRAIKVHPATQKIMVLTQRSGANEFAVLTEIDPDTGHGTGSTKYEEADGDLRLFDITFSGNNNVMTLAGAKYGNFIELPTTALAGSTTSTLYAAVADFNGKVPFEGLPWQVEESPGVYQTLLFVNRWEGVSGTTRQGSGAVFDIVIGGSGPYTYDSVTATTAGTNYRVGHKILVDGTALEGLSGTNDATITVTGVDGSGGITSATISGTYGNAHAAPYTYNTITGTNYQVGSGAVFTFRGSNTNYNNNNYNVTSSGSNYVTGDVITIAGTDLGGASPANDLTFTVTGVGGSGQINFGGSAGTQQSTFYKLSFTGSTEFAPDSSYTVVYPLNQESLIIQDGVITIGGGDVSESEDYIRAIAVDSDHTIYAISSSKNGLAPGNALTNYNLAVVYKITGGNTVQWAKVLNNTDYDCYPISIAQASDGIIALHHDDNSYQAVITKLSTAGAVQWQKSVEYNNALGSVAVDSDDNIYVLLEVYNNYDQGNSGYTSLALFKLAPNGEAIWKRWVGTEWDDYLDNNNYDAARSISVDDEYVYIAASSYATVADYLNAMAIRIPKDGSGTGVYGYFYLRDALRSGSDYDINTITSFDYITTQTADVHESAVTETPASAGYFYTDYWDRENPRQVITDRSGGNIVFADGTTQDSTAQDIPQIPVKGYRYRISRKDRGKHLYVTDGGVRIIVPYHNSEPLPIGTTVTVINDSGDSLTIYPEGGAGPELVYPDNGTGAVYLDPQGMMTLIKVQTNRWFVSGGPGGMD